MLFDLAVLYLLWFCALCVLKKGWLATVVYGGFFGAVATTDYLKYSMTGDYFYPWDLAEQAGHLGELKNFITVPFPVLYIAMILFVFVMAVIVFFSGCAAAGQVVRQISGARRCCCLHGGFSLDSGKGHETSQQERAVSRGHGASDL